MRSTSLSVALAITLPGLCPAQQAGSEAAARPIDRRLAFTEESLHGAPTGHHELETWLTWSGHTDQDHGFQRLDVKHELEYGLSETVHLGVDLAEWHWQDSGGERHTRYDLTAAEVKFRLLDPRSDLVGLALKTELGVGPVGLEWENWLIVDKIVDRWLFAYNLHLGAGWDGEKLFEFHEGEGELSQHFGASCELSPQLCVGAELLHEVPLPDWQAGEDQDLYLGPNVAWHGHDWALTVTSLFQLTGGEDAPAFLLRAIFEFDF